MRRFLSRNGSVCTQQRKGKFQVNCARELIQGWEETGVFNANWLAIIGFAHYTVLLHGEAGDREHLLERMIAKGGQPIGLVSRQERGDGSSCFDYCLMEEYYGKEWVHEYVRAVLVNSGTHRHEWATRYLNFVKSFAEQGISAATVAMREFLKAH